MINTFVGRSFEIIDQVFIVLFSQSKDVSNLIFRYVEMIAAEDKSVHR